MNWKDLGMFSVPVSNVSCYKCGSKHKVKDIPYLEIAGEYPVWCKTSYSAPHCPGCGELISFSRMKISDKFASRALSKAAAIFYESDKDPGDYEISFVSIFMQGTVSGCASIWPKEMDGNRRSTHIDRYIHKIFGASTYVRSLAPKELEQRTELPASYVYVRILDKVSRTTIVDFSLN